MTMINDDLKCCGRDVENKSWTCVKILPEWIMLKCEFVVLKTKFFAQLDRTGFSYKQVVFEYETFFKAFFFWSELFQLKKKNISNIFSSTNWCYCYLQPESIRCHMSEIKNTNRIYSNQTVVYWFNTWLDFIQFCSFIYILFH